MKLYENTPALRFEDAHLLGNGDLGATVYGGVIHEKLLINHDTLWSGEEKNKVNPKSKIEFQHARDLVLNEQYREANELINNQMVGNWSESFLPLGFIHLTYGNTSDLRDMEQKRVLNNEIPYRNYRRELDLDNAIEHIEYEQDGSTYYRDYYVSKPDNLVGMRLSVDGKSNLSLSISVDSPLKYSQLISEDDNSLSIVGRAPDKVESYNPKYNPEVLYKSDEESNAIRFAATVRIKRTDGKVTSDGYRVYIEDASFIELVASAVTNYEGYKKDRDKDTERLLIKSKKILDASDNYSYDDLLGRHVEDYKILYNRFNIDLGEDLLREYPTSKRIKYFQTIEDPGLSALVVQYSRYLLIASSRAGTQPMNLQGIWNANPCPMWASNYTTNINVQMCYWSVESLNLSELHQPLIQMIHEVADSGSIVAREAFGMNGWTVHHNTDLWRMTSVAGEDASWSWWPTAGLWLVRHLWEHYLYSKDSEYLNEAFPTIQGAIDFIIDFLVYDENEGYFVSAPSSSPENKFIVPGRNIYDNEDDVIQLGNTERFSPDHKSISTVSKITTMDLLMILDTIDIYEQAARETGSNINERIIDIKDNLPQLQIGKHGQLQEWEKDFDECTPGMPHVSHLYGVYPADTITDTTKDLFAAAKVTLDRRVRHGAMIGHWPNAWNLCLNARFRDETSCYIKQKDMSVGIGANFITDETLQIDSVMGWSAGIVEMLLQTQQECHELLPCLPSSWRSGTINGMKGRKDIEYGISWKNGQLIKVTMFSKEDKCQEVKYKDTIMKVELTGGKLKTMSFQNGQFKI